MKKYYRHRLIMLGLVLLMVSNDCKGISIGKNDEGKMSNQKKCIQIADKKIIDLGYNPKEYDIAFQADENTYMVTYAPKQLQFGGGVEITIDKKDFTIKDVKHQQ